MHLPIPKRQLDRPIPGHLSLLQPAAPPDLLRRPPPEQYPRQLAPINLGRISSLSHLQYPFPRLVKEIKDSILIPRDRRELIKESRFPEGELACLGVDVEAAAGAGVVRGRGGALKEGVRDGAQRQQRREGEAGGAGADDGDGGAGCCCHGARVVGGGVLTKAWRGGGGGSLFVSHLCPYSNPACAEAWGADAIHGPLGQCIVFFPSR